jgi:uncharacterized membrane protein
VNRYRELWMLRALARDMRMVDMQIMTSLQNGTAFFASTSLIALGGALALLRATDEIMTMISTMPFALQTTRDLGRPRLSFSSSSLLRILLPGWSYRLFNYVVITFARCRSRPKRTTRSCAPRLADRALVGLAGRHFNRGQRALSSRLLSRLVHRPWPHDHPAWR